MYQVVQSMSSRNISYETTVWNMHPEECERHRMDNCGFPQDAYQGQHQYDQFDGLQIGWYPMIQLLHTCPDVVMTYFLRIRPMEIEQDTNWHYWLIC